MGKGKKKSANQPKNQQDPAGSGSQPSSSRGSIGDKSKDKKDPENLKEKNQPKQKQPVVASSGSQPSTSASGNQHKDSATEVKKDESKMKPLEKAFAEVTVTKKQKLTSEEWAMKKMAKKGKNKQQQQEELSKPIKAEPQDFQQPSTSQMFQNKFATQPPSRSYPQPQQPALHSYQQQPAMEAYQQQPTMHAYQQQPSTQSYPQQSTRQVYQQHPSSQGYQQPQQPARQERHPETTTDPSKIHKRGTLGTKIDIETNYLALDLQHMPAVAYHYDVKIEPFKINPDKEAKPIPKKFQRQAFNTYVDQVFHGFLLAYDGEASAYSAVELDKATLDKNEGKEVEFQLEDGRENKFRVTVKPTADVKVDLKSLLTYQNDRIYDKPMRALQCIEVVLATACHKAGIRVGRSFFPRPKNAEDLGDGYELWLGLYQAAMLCDQPLLNVDVSHKSFPSQVNLINFYNSQEQKFARYPPDQKEMYMNQKLGEFLKGLCVMYNPPKNFESGPKRFKFLDVVGKASVQKFTIDGTVWTVNEYYISKGKRLQYPDLPCLHVGKAEKNIYIPLELISIPPGQAIMRKDNDNQIRNMIKKAATSTTVRKSKIFELLRTFQYYSDPLVSRFGINVGKEFIEVEARILNAPRLQYKQEKLEIQMPGLWNASRCKFLLTTPNQNKWAILNFSRIPNNKLQNFVKLVKDESRRAGMSLEPECSKIEQRQFYSNGISLSGFKNINLLFVILPFGSEAYSKIKQEAELSCGIVTQCIKSDTISRQQRDGVKEIDQMTVRNILLKVNAKLNGINHAIANESKVKLQKDSKIMFVGADVSHPSPLQKTMPSIVGVVASHDENGFQYNMQYRLQTPKEETIVDMKDIFYKHLQVYFSKWNKYPEVVIYYRDGVSDGQFKAIEKVELDAMRAACKIAEATNKSKAKCKPKFTCIIVVKRHHTRFFPKIADTDDKRFINVKAGTVVDKKIIHPGEEQFFMVSHKSVQGTSKPTRYNVIVDDSDIPIDDIQALTYNMCHLFPRCNRSVSYPTPAYLSHLVGLRGRAYIQGRNINLNDLRNECREISKEMDTNPMYFI